MSINKLYDLLLVEKDKNNIIGELRFDVDMIKYEYSRLDTHTTVEDVYETDLAQIEHILYINKLTNDISITEPELDEDYVSFFLYE